MSSISVQTARNAFPAKDDRTIAARLAAKEGWHAIVAYTNQFTHSNEHTNWRLCVFQEELSQYLHLRNAEVLYNDGCAESMHEAEERTMAYLRSQGVGQKKAWQFWK